MGEYQKEKHFDLFRHHKSKHSTTSTEDRKIFRFVSARRKSKDIILHIKKIIIGLLFLASNEQIEIFYDTQ